MQSAMDMHYNIPFLALILVALMPVTARPSVPVYQINLDLPAKQRWLAVAADYKKIVPNLRRIVADVVPKSVIPLVEKLGVDVDKYLPKLFVDEMKGIATVFNISLAEITIVNIVYDLTAHCTSIVNQDKRGRIWHSRNLDYGYTETLRNATIHVDFVRKGKVVYSAITFAGYVGILTGQKPHAFTISVDERNTNSSLWENALTALLDRSASMISFSVRQTLEDAVSFTQAVVKLTMGDTLAPVYYIVGGVHPGQGAIITRDRLSTADAWFMDPANGRWFILETNYDHWKPPPKSDDRRDAASRMMKSVGRDNIDAAHLFKVMATYPVGGEETVYTTIMSAGQPKLFSTWVWPLNASSPASPRTDHLTRAINKWQRL